MTGVMGKPFFNAKYLILIEFSNTRDRNWSMIPQHMRHQLGLTFEDDGEFYMSFRDFMTYFGELEICHLTPDSYDDETRKKFEVFHFYGEWKRGSTAGGCGNDGNSEIFLKYIIEFYFTKFVFQ